MSSAKTEDPTPQRLRQLREKGQVPISRRLTSVAALLGGLLAVFALGGEAARAIAALLRAALAADADPFSLGAVAARLTATSALAVAGAAAVAAVFAGGVQTGWNIAPKKLAPSLKGFDPIANTKARVRKDAWWSGVLSLAQAAVGVGITWGAVRAVLAALPSATAAATRAGDGAPLAALAVDTLTTVGAAWLGLALFAALADAGVQRRLFLDRNRMSLQEVRDEYKRSEGDPEHKARRERAHRELLQTSFREGVKRADVVVRNPTHLAIGLRYRPDEAEAPVITCLGRGDLAKRIVREARRKAVPEYYDRPVARSLIELEVDDEVPPELFEAVAVIFRWLRELE